MIKYWVLICAIISIILLSNIISADNALVDINLDLNNIAILNDSSPNTNLKAIIPYEEIIKVDNYIDEQTKLGRTIKIKWHIVNYEPNEEIYSDEIGGFHLFDFTWFRLRTFVEYKDKGQWTSMISVPTAFNFEPYSEATIYSYGDVPVLISPTICPGGFCLGGGGEQQGKFQEEVIKKIEKENYRISIIKYPVTKSVYLMLNDSNLSGKKWEIEGSFNLGDSAIVTNTKSTFFPFDKYSLELIYSSYYNSKVNFYIKNIEDLSLSSEKDIEISTIKNENKNINLFLVRDNPIKYLWELLIILLPTFFYIFQRKWDVGVGLRIGTYILELVSSVIIIFPLPLNIPLFNISNIIICLLYFSSIIIIETILFKQRKNK